MSKYFLDQDGDSHWVIVCAEYRNRWETWKELNEDDPESWELPDFAKYLNSHPNRMEFENPMEK